ncbi:MAG TPA: hypothetical protein VJR69_02360 [Nitrospira sp.]|nr:hypothetical protein [Nitrospira sp.]
MRGKLVFGSHLRRMLCTSLLLAVTAAITAPSSGQSENTVALEQLPAQHEVSGTLAKLDVAAGKGMLMTDLQKPIFFRLDRPELFERLSVGDRVTMQLDDEGRVLKVIETLPAEVHEPPPPAK